MALSPMMRHYISTKERYKNALLFYRLGDFYELFFEDAVTASKELELTLTGKDCGLEKRAPMCGVPYHAVDSYIAKLIAKGYNVAICEQLTDPKPGQIVERDVVRVITAGTVVENSILDETKNNFIASIYVTDNGFGYSYLDISTGEFNVAHSLGGDYISKLNDMIITSHPSEIICNAKAKEISNDLLCVKAGGIPEFKVQDDKLFDAKLCHETLISQFGSQYVKDINKTDENILISAGALVSYVTSTSCRPLNHIKMYKQIPTEEYMSIDMNSRRNLEITETLRDRKKRGSILWLLDKTRTAMGARMLASWVDRPLYNETKINHRLKGIRALISNLIARDSLAKILDSVYDIERLCGRLSFGTITPKDCLALSASLKQVPKIKEAIDSISSPIINEIKESLTNYNEITDLIDRAIVDEPPANLKDGGYIKKGYSSELDEVLNIGTVGKVWLGELEAREKQKTGIAKLKTGYNRVFGYYIEIPRSQAELVPFEYHRRQTTSTCERFVTEELKEIEDKILNAEDRRLELESNLYTELKNTLSGFIPALQKTSVMIATLDALLSLANVALEHNFCEPSVSSKYNHISITNGRHPVVEALLKDSEFVPNDTLLDDEDNRTMIITGPNMAGKSTYMRQVAVIVLLAHIGSFVPASKAEICLVDKIFTRVGASDDLAFGQSTFMVEMTEVSNIIKNATNNSLIILDEVGRGTSTFDGLAIAWSVMEYLSSHLHAKTLFATHYHELTDLEGKLDGVKNFRVSVKEYDNSVIFLRKIVRGGANKSFGIEVAGLAGLPEEILTRAREILHEQEEKSLATNSELINSSLVNAGKQSKVANEIYSYVKDINLDTLTPLSAFDILVDLKGRIK